MPSCDQLASEYVSGLTCDQIYFHLSLAGGLSSCRHGNESVDNKLSIFVACSKDWKLKTLLKGWKKKVELSFQGWETVGAHKHFLSCLGCGLWIKRDKRQHVRQLSKKNKAVAMLSSKCTLTSQFWGCRHTHNPIKIINLTHCTALQLEDTVVHLKYIQESC